MRAVVLLATGLLLVTAPPARAQWRIAVFTGNVSTARADVLVTAPAAGSAVEMDDVRFEDASSRAPIYYGWRVARHFRRAPWLGIEGEFLHAKAITQASDVVHVHGRLAGAPIDADAPVGAVLPRFELSHGLNFLLANAILRLGVGGGHGPDARVAITVRGGAGPTLPHVEATVADAREDTYRLGHIGWQAAAGVDVRLSSRLSAVADVKWTGTNQHLEVGDAVIATRLRTLHVVAGVGWRF